MSYLIGQLDATGQIQVTQIDQTVIDESSVRDVLAV